MYCVVKFTSWKIMLLKFCFTSSHHFSKNKQKENFSEMENNVVKWHGFSLTSCIPICLKEIIKTVNSYMPAYFCHAIIWERDDQYEIVLLTKHLTFALRITAAYLQGQGGDSDIFIPS